MCRDRIEVGDIVRVASDYPCVVEDREIRDGITWIKVEGYGWLKETSVELVAKW